VAKGSMYLGHALSNIAKRLGGSFVKKIKPPPIRLNPDDSSFAIEDSA
jgi:hypothetical protein